MTSEPEKKEEPKEALEQLTSDLPPQVKEKPKSPKKVGTEALAPPRMPRPSNAVLTKLAEIITYTEVSVVPGLNALNKDHLRVLLKDYAMLEWMKEMEKLKMIPDNARKQ